MFRRRSPGRGVEDAQHGHKTVGGALRASNGAARGSDLAHAQPDAPRRLADACALLQRVVDAIDAVLLHTAGASVNKVGDMEGENLRWLATYMDL